VRLVGFHADAFGCLAGFGADGLDEHPVLVVLGDNESGKTTFAHFLETMLFGFAPASAERHPYRPHDLGGLEGRATFELDDGRRVVVQRRLRSRADGLLLLAGDGDEVRERLGNRKLPWTGSLARPLYRSLHALTLDDARHLGQQTWEQVEARLLAGSHLSFLRPAHEVVDELDARANALWRPDRRGKPLDARLRERRAELTSRRERAEAATRRLLEIRARARASDERLARLEQELGGVQARLEEMRRLDEVLQRVARIEALRTEAAAVLERDVPLPDDPEGETRALEERVGRATERLAELDERYERAVARTALGTGDKRLLALEDEIEALARKTALHDQDRALIADLEADLSRKASTLKHESEALFGVPLDDRRRAALDDLSFGELREAVAAHERDRARLERVEIAHAEREEARREAQTRLDELGADQTDPAALDKRLRALAQLRDTERLLANLPADFRARPTRPPGRQLAGNLVGLAGLALTITGAFASLTSQVGFFVAGAALLVVAAALLLARGGAENPGDALIASTRRECTRTRQRLELAPEADLGRLVDRAEERLEHARQRPVLAREAEAARAAASRAGRQRDEARRAGDASRRAIADQLAALDVDGSWLEAPGTALVRQLETVAALDLDVAMLHGKKLEVLARFDGREGLAAALARRLGERVPGDAMSLVPRWHAALQDARDVRHRARAASEELPRLRFDRDEAKARRSEAVCERDDQRALLALFDPDRGASGTGDPDAGLAAVVRALEVRRRADVLAQALAESHPDWREQLARAEALRRSGELLEPRGDEARAAERRLVELRAAIGAVREERGQLAGERQQLLEREGADSVDGAIAALDEQREGLRRRRDRLALLASVVREADRRYREEHQPDVVRAASGYVRVITGGRYERVSVEATDGAPELWVQARDDEFQRALDDDKHPLSRGTREQIALAFRFALADHVDGDEPLPMLLDELFVTWDPDRIERGCEVLAEIGRRRQILVFTCHPTLAGLLRRKAGAAVLTMPGGGGDEPAAAPVIPATRPAQQGDGEAPAAAG